MKALKSNAIGRCAKPSQMRRLVARVLVAAGLLAFAGPSYGVNVTWNVAGSGNWDLVTGNWTGAAVVYTNGDAATFNNTAGGTITLVGVIAPLSTTVSAASGTYTFTGAGITSGSLTKSGAGSLILNGANTYTGGTTLSGGILSISSAANLGAPLGAALVDFTGNATLNVTNSFTTTKEFTSIGAARSITLDIDSGDVLTANGNIRAFSGAGTVTKSGLGTLIIGADNTQLDTDITLTGGTLDVRNAGGIGNIAAGDFVLASAGTTTRLTFNANTTVTGSFQTQGSGVALVVDRVAAGAGTTTSMTNLTLNGVHTLNVNAGANVTSGTAGLTFSGTTTLNGNAIINVTDPGAANILLTLAGVTGTNRNLTIGGNGNTTINGNITTGSGTLVKNGDGLLILNGANTYTGVTTVNTGGILRVRNSSALGTSAGGTTIAGNLNDGILELANNINVASEAFTLSARQGAAIDVPHIRNQSGDNIIGGNIVLTTGGSDYNIESAAGLLTINGDITNSNTGLRRLKLSGASNGIINGNILVNAAGTNPLVKDGSGTWTLAGNNNYNGTTTINAGTLALGSAGSIDNSPMISIGTGATFNVSAATGYNLVSGQSIIGNGSILGDVIADAGSLLSPGFSVGDIGTLAFANSLDINGSVLIEVDAAAAGQKIDIINVGNVLDISGASLTFSFLSAPGQNAFVFSNYGSLVGEFANISVLPVGYQVQYNFGGNNQIALVSIPEPATMSLLALGGLAMLRRRRVMR